VLGVHRGATVALGAAERATPQVVYGHAAVRSGHAELGDNAAVALAPVAAGGADPHPDHARLVAGDVIGLVLRRVRTAGDVHPRLRAPQERGIDPHNRHVALPAPVPVPVLADVMVPPGAVVGLGLPHEAARGGAAVACREQVELLV